MMFSEEVDDRREIKHLQLIKQHEDSQKREWAMNEINSYSRKWGVRSVPMNNKGALIFGVTCLTPGMDENKKWNLNKFLSPNASNFAGFETMFPPGVSGRWNQFSCPKITAKNETSLY